MGLCIDPNENPQGLMLEIRRESVIMTEPGQIFSELDGRVEISKTYLTKLLKLFNDPVWRERLTREGVYSEKDARAWLP